MTTTTIKGEFKRSSRSRSAGGLVPAGARTAPSHSASWFEDPRSTWPAGCPPLGSSGSDAPQLENRTIGSARGRSPQPDKRSSQSVLTVLRLMVGTSAHNDAHVLRLLVDGHDSQDGAGGGLLADQHLHRGGLGQLAVQLAEELRILRRKSKAREDTRVITCGPARDWNPEPSEGKHEEM